MCGLDVFYLCDSLMKLPMSDGEFINHACLCPSKRSWRAWSSVHLASALEHLGNFMVVEAHA